MIHDGARSAASTCTSASTMSGESLSVGSSISSTEGLVMSARAIASICCSPPEGGCTAALDAAPAELDFSGVQRSVTHDGDAFGKAE